MAPHLLPSVVALLIGGAPAPPPALNPPLPEAPWVVNRVSTDGRTLVLWTRRGGCDPELAATVTETADSVELHVRHAGPASTGLCPANLTFEKLAVRLQ